MCRVANELILPVPEVLRAIYLVPSSLSAEAARERAKAAVLVRAGSHLRAALAEMLGSRLVTFSAQSSSALPALPTGLQKNLGATPEQVRWFGPDSVAMGRCVWNGTDRCPTLRVI
jgi:hypothetical protein